MPIMLMLSPTKDHFSPAHSSSLSTDHLILHFHGIFAASNQCPLVRLRDSSVLATFHGACIPERSEREVWTNKIYLPALFLFPKLLPYFFYFPNHLLILPHPGTTQPLPSQGRIQEFWRLLGCLWMDFAKILGDYRVHG